MPPEILDEGAESSTAADDSAATSAGTQNTDPAEQVPFHKHPRWQEVMSELKQLRGVSQRIPQLEQDNAGLKMALERLQAAKASPGEGPSPEYIEAAKALIKVMETEPRLKTLLSLSDAAPHLIRGYQGVQQLTKTQQQTLLAQGRQRVHEFAAKAELPTAERALKHIEEMVAGTIRSDPELVKRFQDGDLSVFETAFKEVEEGFVGLMRRAANADLKQNKDQLRRLPPAPKGGPAGREAPLKLEEGKEKDFERSMHASATKRLESLLTG